MRLLFLYMAFFALSMPAWANDADLLVRAGFVQCGALEELNYACEYDDRCCALKELFWEGAEEEPFVASTIPDGSAVIEAIRNNREIILSDSEALALQ